MSLYIYKSFLIKNKLLKINNKITNIVSEADNKKIETHKSKQVENPKPNQVEIIAT